MPIVTRRQVDGEAIHRPTKLTSSPAEGTRLSRWACKSFGEMPSQREPLRLHGRAAADLSEHLLLLPPGEDVHRTAVAARPADRPDLPDQPDEHQDQAQAAQAEACDGSRGRDLFLGVGREAVPQQEHCCEREGDEARRQPEDQQPPVALRPPEPPLGRFRGRPVEDRLRLDPSLLVRRGRCPGRAPGGRLQAHAAQLRAVRRPELPARPRFAHPGDRRAGPDDWPLTCSNFQSHHRQRRCQFVPLRPPREGSRPSPGRVGQPVPREASGLRAAITSGLHDLDPKVISAWRNAE